MSECLFCAGEGVVTDSLREWWEFWRPRKVECFTCHGSGESPKEVDYFLSNLRRFREHWRQVTIEDVAQGSKFNQVIGLDPQVEGVFLVDTINGNCYGLKYLSGFEPVSELLSYAGESYGARQQRRMREILMEDALVKARISSSFSKSTIDEDLKEQGRLHQKHDNCPCPSSFNLWMPSPKDEEPDETMGGIPVPDEIAKNLKRVL